MELHGQDNWALALQEVAYGVGLVEANKVNITLDGSSGLKLADGRVITDFVEALETMIPHVPLTSESRSIINDCNATGFQLTTSHPLIGKLNDSIGDNTSITGSPTLTATDFVLHASLKEWISTADPADKKERKNLIKWYSAVTKVLNQKKERPLDDISRFNLIVGKVVEAWEHPDADSLYCEKIDVGEAEPRSIASGLRHFIPKEKLEGAKVIILANMKSKSLRGYPSQGMVMCGSDETHSKVALLAPPESAKIGDRVTFEGYSMKEPDAVLSTKKNQEPIPILLENLRVDANGVAYWKTYKMVVNGEPCLCESIPNGRIS